jgi:uncharacterized repeat protein (TIGR03803 family)
VFSLTPSASLGGPWTEALLYSFTNTGDGNGPLGAVAIGSAPKGYPVLYGTTYGYEGTVFALTPPASPGGVWTLTTLYGFGGGSDGGVPVAGVAIATSGLLCGTTESGGASNAGTVFKLKP